MSGRSHTELIAGESQLPITESEQEIFCRELVWLELGPAQGDLQVGLGLLSL